MTKTGKIISLVLMLSFFALSAAQAQTIMLHQSQGQAEMPNVHVLRNGDVLVVFSEGHHFNSDAELFYRRKSKATGNWSAVKKAVTKFSSSAFAQLAEDSVGNVHMVWMDGNSSRIRDIFYAWYDVDKDKWSSKSKVYESAGVNSSWPRLKIESDIMYIVWSHNYDEAIGLQDVVMVTSPVGGPLPVPKFDRITISNLGQSVSVHSAFDVKEGRVYACWMDDDHKSGNWNIYFSEGSYNPNKDDWDFVPSVQLFPSVNQYYPALAVDDNHRVHVFFSGGNGPYYHAMKEGNNWTNPQAISKQGTIFPVIAFMRYSHGLVHACWTETTSKGEGVFYGRALPDGTWADSIMVENDLDFPGYPAMDMDNDGNVHVVFSDGDEDHPRHIFYSEVELPGTPPTAVITANKTTGLVPLTVNFSGAQSTDDGKIKEYRWDFGDGNSDSGKQVTHTFKQRGTYIVTLSVIDDTFRAGTDQIEIVASSGEPFASFTTTATEGMIPLTVNFDASESADVDGTIASYNWDFGDGTTATGVTTSHTYEFGGRFDAKLTVIDDEGKSDSVTVEIAVYQKPEAVMEADRVAGRVPLKITFSSEDSYDVDGAIENNRWDFGDGSTKGGKNVNHTYSTPGTYTVILTVTDNDGYTGTAMMEVYILDRPLPPVNIKVERMANKTLFFTDHINHVTWEPNPHNAELTVTGYRIYRKPMGSDDSQYALAGEVAGGLFEYDDRQFASADEADGFVYAVTAVDDQGGESDLPDSTAIQASAAQRSLTSRSRIVKYQ